MGNYNSLIQTGLQRAQTLLEWDTPPGKELRSAEVLAEGGGNTEWVVEEGSSKYQLRLHDQSQKWGLS